jgi:hypothetical protein
MTSKDGFINVYQEPIYCAKNLTILNSYEKKVAETSGYMYPKNKYRSRKRKIQNTNLHKRGL